MVVKKVVYWVGMHNHIGLAKDQTKQTNKETNHKNKQAQSPEEYKTC